MAGIPGGDGRGCRARCRGVAAVAFWGYCLWDFTGTDERDLRAFTRPLWVVVLVLGSTLGALLWFFTGRPRPPRR